MAHFNSDCFITLEQNMKGTSIPLFHFTGDKAMHTTQHGLQQINQTRQIAQQLIQQTQQASHQYRIMLQQEQQNIQMLEQILQREKQAAQVIEQSLQKHDLAINRCQDVVELCNQMQQDLNNSVAFSGQSYFQQPINGQNQYQFRSQFNNPASFYQQ